MIRLLSSSPSSMYKIVMGLRRSTQCILGLSQGSQGSAVHEKNCDSGTWKLVDRASDIF